jgi:hypothetical protein
VLTKEEVGDKVKQARNDNDEERSRSEPFHLQKSSPRSLTAMVLTFEVPRILPKSRGRPLHLDMNDILLILNPTN